MSEIRSTAENTAETADRPLEQAYMNRLFCSTRERVAYVLKCALGELNIGKYTLQKA